MLRDYCNISISGGNPYPIVNAVRQSPIACAEQCIHGDSFTCRIHRRDLPALRELAEQFHMTIDVKRPHSVEGHLLRYRLRIGIPVGLLLGLLLILWQSNTVETIEIQGNVLTPESAIVAQLADAGVSRGTWIPGMDVYAVETHIRSNLSELAWVSIRHTGSRLVVEVSEITKPPEMLHERTPCNIVSARDAQITSVRVYSGQLMHLVGDGVTKGELLVSGMLLDETGHTSWRHAYASIIGIYEHQAELKEAFREEKRIPTGQVTRQKWLRIFGLRIPLTWKRPDYAQAEIAESETPVYLFHAALPVSVMMRTSAEISTEITTRSLPELRTAMHDSIRRYEANMLSDVTILDRSEEISESPEGLTCTLHYRVEGEIGEERDFYIK